MLNVSDKNLRGVKCEHLGMSNMEQCTFVYQFWIRKPGIGRENQST